MLNKIRLELARDHDHPEGLHAIGYEFAAPLDENGQIDADEWHKQPRPLPGAALPAGRGRRHRPSDPQARRHLGLPLRHPLRRGRRRGRLPLRRPCLQARRICLDPRGRGLAHLQGGAGPGGLAWFPLALEGSGFRRLSPPARSPLPIAPTFKQSRDSSWRPTICSCFPATASARR